jgi:integrase
MGTNQRGSLRVESGSWYGYFNTTVYDAQTNTKRRKQRAVKLGAFHKLSKAEAYKALAGEIERAFSGGISVRPDPTVTLEVFTRTRWLPQKEAIWRDGSKSAAKHVLSHVMGAFGAAPLEKLDAVALQRWLNKLATTHSDSLVKHCRYYLKSILEWAVWEDYLRKNPAKFLKLPTTKPVEKGTLTTEQFNAVLAELEPPFDLLVRVGAACAFRPSELLALRWRDFDPKAGVFHIRETIYRGKLRPFTKTTKAGSTEKHLLTVVIPDALVKEVVKHRGPLDHGYPTKPFTTDHDFIFNTYKGTFIHKDNLLNRVLYPVRDKLKLPVLNFQVLRRTMATLSQHSGSVKDVQAHLRHKSPDVTAQEYMQPITEATREMVNTVYTDMMKKPKRKKK